MAILSVICEIKLNLRALEMRVLKAYSHDLFFFYVTFMSFFRRFGANALYPDLFI